MTIRQFREHLRFHGFATSRSNILFASGCKAMESLDVPKLYNGMGKSPYVRCPLKQFPGALVLNPERLRGSKPSLKKFPGVPMVGRGSLRGGFPLGGGGCQ